MALKRKAGVLCHPTSFPSAYGIGDLGLGAFQFVDFLYQAGQKLWQVLPLNPISYGDSPYQSPSSFAGNYLLISPDLLLEKGLVDEGDLTPLPLFDEMKVDYNTAASYKDTLFRRAFLKFDTEDKKYTDFCKKNKFWLMDYTLFIALKKHFADERKIKKGTQEHLDCIANLKAFAAEEILDDYYLGAMWFTWPKEIKDRDKKAVLDYTNLLKDEIEYQKFLQYIFYEQWAELKAYANDKEIEIIGDMPIFVSADSADMWANPELFLTDKEGPPSCVAGVPPDYFSETGQMWGNPLYNWQAHEETGYAWWIQRFKFMLKMVDILRIDHFRGFDSYWQIPAGEKTAVKGKWVKGPGCKVFKAVSASLSDLPVIAEDLGIITDSVRKLRKKLKYPGMKILQFAFDDTNENAYLPHNFTDNGYVIYTGTHDNDTTLGWFGKQSEKVKDYVRRYLNVSGEDISWDMIRLAYLSTAAYAIIPVQDIMSLGTEYRMNTPGTDEGNWLFRYKADMLTENMACGLSYLNKLYNR